MIVAIVLIVAALFCEAIAASANAKMDTVKDHYSVSIYSQPEYNPQWYNPAISWTDKNDKVLDEKLQKEELPVWLRWLSAIKPGWDPISDFWHAQKTTMLFFQTLTCALCMISAKFLPGGLTLLAAGLFVIIDGLVWVGVFNYFYERKLKK